MSDLVAAAARPRPARRHRHVRPRVRRRLRGGVGVLARSRSRATSRTPTSSIVAMGPGIVGTGTRLGFSGIEVGPVLDAARGARRRADRVPAGVVRRRARPRHRGLSHHSATALRVATREPRAGRGAVRRRRRRGAASARRPRRRRHRRAATTSSTSIRPTRSELFAQHGSARRVDGTTGRRRPVLFEAAAAAGALAAY